MRVWTICVGKKMQLWCTLTDISVSNWKIFSNSFKDKTEDGWIVTRAKTKVCICDDENDDNDDSDDHEDNDDANTKNVNFMVYIRTSIFYAQTPGLKP